MIATMKSEVATGRRMKGRDGLMRGGPQRPKRRAASLAVPAPPLAGFGRRAVRLTGDLTGGWRCSRGCRLPGGRGRRLTAPRRRLAVSGGGCARVAAELHRGAVAQLVRAVDHDLVADR